MGDMAEVFRDMREHDRQRRQRNLENAYASGTDGWTVHHETHWSRMLQGHKLEYWPSKNKWRWLNKTYTGDVHGFIKNREKQGG